MHGVSSHMQVLEIHRKDAKELVQKLRKQTINSHFTTTLLCAISYNTIAHKHLMQ